MQMPQGDSRRFRDRRWTTARRSAVLVILAFILAAVLAGFTPAAAQELKFSFTPVLTEADMRAESEPLMIYLSEKIAGM